MMHGQTTLKKSKKSLLYVSSVSEAGCKIPKILSQPDLESLGCQNSNFFFNFKGLFFAEMMLIMVMDG